MSNDEVIAAADANLFEAARTFARARAGGEVWKDGGLFVAASGAPLRSFNSAFIIRPSVDREQLGKAKAYFAQRGVPFRLRVREGLIDDADALLKSAGFERRGGIPGLVMVPLASSARCEPSLEIRRVSTDDVLSDHVGVVASAFDWAPAILATIFSEKVIGNDEWRAYVGYLGALPVVASQLIVSDRVAGIFYVGTREAFRHRGFGEAMTRHAMNEGFEAGCSVASLQASPMGTPLYERMGFRTVTYYRTYVVQEA